jgi:hypothetical protein
MHKHDGPGPTHLLFAPYGRTHMIIFERRGDATFAGSTHSFARPAPRVNFEDMLLILYYPERLQVFLFFGSICFVFMNI